MIILLFNNEIDGIDVNKCLRQYQLIVSNTLITDLKPKTLKDVWYLLVSSIMGVIYPELGKAVQIAVTLPVTSVSVKRFWDQRLDQRI